MLGGKRQTRGLKISCGACSGTRSPSKTNPRERRESYAQVGLVHLGILPARIRIQRLPQCHLKMEPGLSGRPPDATCRIKPRPALVRGGENQALQGIHRISSISAENGVAERVGFEPTC